jgi:hypothetical protein
MYFYIVPLLRIKVSLYSDHGLSDYIRTTIYLFKSMPLVLNDHECCTYYTLHSTELSSVNVSYAWKLITAEH